MEANDIEGSKPDHPRRRCSETQRRIFLKTLAAAGIGGTTFQRAMAQQAESIDEVTVEMVQNAEWVAGIELTDEEREKTAESLRAVLRKRRQLRNVEVDYDTLPALQFNPEMLSGSGAVRSKVKPSWLTPGDPNIDQQDQTSATADDTAYASVRELGRMLRSGAVTSVDITKRCIDRLRTLDPVLKCVVTFTEELALRQAEAADTELAAGKDRGALHGIPWGAKDLIAVEGYPTTWGAPQFREQVLSETATVAKKLEQAGAVLVAKLSLGALAMGDRWFGGQTKNPWNPEQGSSGSSAGSAAAVAAGAVPFAIGSETLGSIVSPCRRCGVSGLRPTFGRVSRNGCMPLSWSMDKIGPIARHIDDCGLVFRYMHGADAGDPTSVDRWFDWPMSADFSMLRIGRAQGLATRAADEVLLETLESMGAKIIPIKLPTEFPEWAVSLMLDAEAATVFHQLVANSDTEGLNRWPDTFRKLHFLSAVDYLHAARLRTKIMEQMSDVFKQVDVYVGGGDLGICNLTGHPTVVLPSVMSDNATHPQPTCATLTGRLHDEATVLAVAAAAEAKMELIKAVPKLPGR